jgi:hypothetical protein
MANIHITFSLYIFASNRWDFKTEQHDIKFGVRAVNLQTGEKFNELDLKRIAAHETEEAGAITCQANHRCEYTLSLVRQHVINV